MRTIVVKALIIKNGKYLMLWPRANDKTGAEEWEIPGAKMGKSSTATLIKAVKEQCHLKIDVIKPVRMYSYIHKKKQIYVIIFACRYTSGKVRIQKKRYSSYRWVNPNKTKPIEADDAVDLSIG